MEELFQQSILFFVFSRRIAPLSVLRLLTMIYSSKVVVCEREMDLGCSEGGLKKRGIEREDNMCTG